MLQYHSIPHLKQCKLLNKPIFAFYKYDGSNLRFEWQPKKGFCKYGSRTQLIDEKTSIFGEAIQLFQEQYAFEIVNRMENFYSKKEFKQLERITVFCEFLGENSFAGNHDQNDLKTLKLFDIHLFKKGFLPPQDFIKLFENFEHMAELIYQGNLNNSFIKEIQENTNQKLNEGVICKGIVNGKVEMVKVKTHSWVEKLKTKCENWESLL